MQPNPTPSAHACTTLPPGNLPMRDLCPLSDLPDWLATGSECGKVKRSFNRQFPAKFQQVPNGTWHVIESRIDDEGEVWFKRDRGVHYVVDDFGFLARAQHVGGAA